MNWLTETKNGIVLTIRVVPRASKNEIAGELGDALKIRLQAPPVEGKANKALIQFLADTLDISRSQITILSGDTGRNKRILLTGVSHHAVENALAKS